MKRLWEIRGQTYGEHGKPATIRVRAVDFAGAERAARAEKIDWHVIILID